MSASPTPTRTLQRMFIAAKSYLFGGATKVRILAGTGTGSTANVGKGLWLLTVHTEAVEVKRDATTVTTPAGTTLPVGTQLEILQLSAQDWAARSAGGTGVIEFTPIENR